MLDDPRTKITLGVSLMLLSFVLLFLMVINVLKLDSSSTIIFSFLLYTLSLIGLVLGLYGIHETIILKRRRESKQ